MEEYAGRMGLLRTSLQRHREWLVAMGQAGLVVPNACCSPHPCSRAAHLGFEASCTHSLASAQSNRTQKLHFIQNNCSLNKITLTKCKWAAVPSHFPSLTAFSLSLVDLWHLTAGFNCCLHAQQCHSQALNVYFHFTSKSEPLQKNYQCVCFDISSIVICP